MKFFDDLNNIFSINEIKKFWIFIVGIFIATLFDALSFITIIPVFNLIFLNKIENISFINLQSIELTYNLKIIILLLFIFIFYLKNIFIIIFNFFFINFIKASNIRIASDLFNNYLDREYVFFLKKSSDNFLQKINNDIISLNTFLISFFNLIVEIIFLLTICIILLIINYKIFLICFFSFLVILIIYHKLFKARITRWADIYRNSTINVQNLVLEGSQGFKDIILYDLKNNFMKNFNTNFQKSSQSYSRMQFLNNIQKYWLELVAFTILVISLFYFIIFDFDVNKLIPVFGLFVVAMFRLLTSINRTIFCYHAIKFTFPSYKAIANEFKEFNDNKKNIFSKNIIFKESICGKKINFSYLNNNFNIISNANFKIIKGDRVLISGKNGSGKTTLLNLIAGLIKPTDGNVVTDEYFDVYNNKQWLKRLSYVQQNVFLLNDTIKTNISLVDSNFIDFVKFNKVNELLKLDDYFKELPRILDTEVGLNGMNLSGGQKQIISLARALYKNGDIIIFDEPSSALDNFSKKLIKELIKSLNEEKTIIMVTHDTEYFSDCFSTVIEINSGGSIIQKKLI
jgi:ABC-type bacteriocin/lantibiotic exporter with double-glycine peptidase domain